MITEEELGNLLADIENFKEIIQRFLELDYDETSDTRELLTDARCAVLDGQYDAWFYSRYGARLAGYAHPEMATIRVERPGEDTVYFRSRKCRDGHHVIKACLDGEESPVFARTVTVLAGTSLVQMYPPFAKEKVTLEAHKWLKR